MQGEFLSQTDHKTLRTFFFIYLFRLWPFDPTIHDCERACSWCER